MTVVEDSAVHYMRSISLSGGGRDRPLLRWARCTKYIALAGGGKSETLSTWGHLKEESGDMSRLRGRGMSLRSRGRH